MQKKYRDKARYWSNVADSLDMVLLPFILLAFGVCLFNIEATPTQAIVFAIWGASIRIRMIMRDIRVDALTREAEEEERRSPTPVSAKPAPRPVDCPNCHISIPIPADYAYSNAKCPHCAHVFRVVS